MDIHRCRFVPYPASSINAIAFSYPSSTSSKQYRNISVRLAIGRANGDIEIWNPLNGVWHQEVIIRGGKDRSIDGLVWTCERDEETPDGKLIPGKLRLFSIGYTTVVTEWDLETLKAKRHASGQHGDIWCLGTPPLAASGARGQASNQGQKLVGGTIDGCLVLYSVDNDDLQLQRVLAKSSSKKTKMVSIAFQSRQVAIVGCSDSSIRAYDLGNGNILRKMTLGSDLAGGAKEIIVWSIKCLPNGDIVSGDSTGQVCIWDGKTYTQVQRIQSHEQDVLSLTTSSDGSAIVSGGMDRRTVLYRPMAGGMGRWAKASHRRYHKHDVKAMASFEGEGISVVVSGGPDASPVVLPLREAGLQHHRTLPYLPQQVALASAPKARLLVSWWDREVHIWTLARSPLELVGTAGQTASAEKNHRLVGRLLLDGEANITSASISQDGDLLVVSTTAEIKAFRLAPKEDHRQGGGPLKVTRIKLLPRTWTQGASLVQISPDGRWVCAIQGGSNASLAKVAQNASQERSGFLFHSRTFPLKRTKRNISKQRPLDGLGSYNRTITQVAFSRDSKLLALADLAGYIDTWILGTIDEVVQNGADESSSAASSSGDSDEEEEEHEAADGISLMTNPRGRLLPCLPAAPAVISFSDDLAAGGDEYTLLTVTTTMQLILLHPIRGAITEWSRRNPSSRLPDAFRTNRDIVKGVVWQGSRVWLYGVSSLFMFDLSMDLSDSINEAGNIEQNGQSQSSRKRKREKNSGAGDKMEKGALRPGAVKTTTTPIGGGHPDQWADVDMEDAISEKDDDNADEENNILANNELQRLRDTQNGNGNSNGTDYEANDVGRRKAWFTYKYRPILGAVPLETRSQQAQNGASRGAPDAAPSVEIALVERPIWDVDLPPRYFGEDEYER